MRTTVLFPHRVRNQSMAALVEQYVTYASRHLKITIEETAYLDRNGNVPQKLLERVRTNDAVFLSERGREVTSVWFKKALQDAGMSGQTLLFLVGDAEGLPPALEQACRRRICLSKLTMPHELALVVLAEQLWRATSMITGHPYHK